MPLHDDSPMPFGKYVGTAMINIPAYYFLWLFNKGCQHAEVKAYIMENLEALKKEAGQR